MLRRKVLGLAPGESKWPKKPAAGAWMPLWHGAKVAVCCLPSPLGACERVFSTLTPSAPFSEDLFKEGFFVRALRFQGLEGGGA